MFDTLSNKLQSALSRLTGRGKLSDEDIDAALREVRLALLEADVNFRVVKKFIAAVKEKAQGADLSRSLAPGQQVVKIVHRALTELMGEQGTKLSFSPTPPSVLMLVGLQGSGKTTSAGKLALSLKKDGRRPLLAACDVYRPAAIEQLITVGRKVGVEVFSLGTGEDPVKIAEAALAKARREAFDPVVLDTAGRLHIDQELMEELRQIKARVKPSEILLVVDAMTGQDAVTVAESFNQQLELTGVILTKMDGDARGGAALSIRDVTNKPIKLVGMGEKLEPLEPFHPERVASRILGMGDILTLIERAEQTISAEDALKMQKKLVEASFTLDDFREQLGRLRTMGSLEELLAMIPGLSGAKQLKGMEPSAAEITKVDAIISSMTPAERTRPEIISGKRRTRIARGSGTTVADVNRLLKQFAQMQKMMRSLSRRRGKLPFGLGRLPLGG